MGFCYFLTFLFCVSSLCGLQQERGQCGPGEFRGEWQAGQLEPFAFHQVGFVSVVPVLNFLLAFGFVCFLWSIGVLVGGREMVEVHILVKHCCLTSYRLSFRGYMVIHSYVA